MINLFKRKPKLLQLGPTVAIDPTVVTAIYPKCRALVIRFSGIGVMEVERNDLYRGLSINDAAAMILAATEGQWPNVGTEGQD